MADWFDLLFQEFKGRGEAMFAFSRKQVEEAFEGEQAVTWEQYQTEWTTYGGSGLQVKRSVLDEFHRRVEADLDAWEARQPEVTVEYAHTDNWDRPCYKVIAHDDGAPVKLGQILKDVSLLPIGEAHTLYDHYQGEPGSPLNIRVVYEQPARHSVTCPKCKATMSDVVVTGNTLTATCDACGWTGTKTK